MAGADRPAQNMLLVTSAAEFPETPDPLRLYNVTYDFSNSGPGIYYSDGQTYLPLATQEWTIRNYGLEGFWTWSDSTVMADPGAGQMRADDSNISTATQLAISTTDSNGIDVRQVLLLLAANDELLVQDVDSVTVTLFTISAQPTDNTTWFLVPVTVASGGNNNPRDGDVMELRWYPDR